MIDYKIFNVTDLATNCVYLIDKETDVTQLWTPVQSQINLLNR